jgi:hypothetical protein
MLEGPDMLTAKAKKVIEQKSLSTLTNERGASMAKFTKRDWLFVAIAAFVISGTALVILYWVYWMGW